MRKDIVMTVLSNHAEVIMGQSPPGNSYSDNKSGMPLLNGADDLTKTGINPKKYTSAPKKTSKKNDVLLCIRATIGNIQYSDGIYCLGRGVAAIRIKNTTLNSEYLIWGLQNKIEYIKQRAKGTTIVGLKKEDLTDFEIPLLPISEQRAIVAKIEELFSDLDKGVADLKKAQDQLKVYRQAVLKKAFEGELTKDWRATNKIDFNWEKTTTGEVMSNISSGSTPKAELLFSSGEIQFLKVYNLNFDGSLNKEKSPVFTTIEIHESTNKRAICIPGDVLINIVGPPLGKVSVIPSIPNVEYNINQAIVRFRPNEKIISGYLSYFLQNPVTINWLEGTSKATAGQYNVKVTTCRAIPLELPCIKEQHQIVKEIETRLSVCNKVEESITESLKKAEALRQSILKKAFEGRLLSTQEIEKCKAAADYELAAVLLEKIKMKQ